MPDILIRDAPEILAALKAQAAANRRPGSVQIPVSLIEAENYCLLQLKLPCNRPDGM